MSVPAIRVENLSKRYKLGARASGSAKYDTFREALVRNLKRPFTRSPSALSSDLRPLPPSSPDSVAATHARPDRLSPPAPRAPAVLCPPSSVVSPSPSEFWALRDVSFEIQPGEVVGIIGRNGAGKSTLLKILSRIIEPTSGRVSVRGRLASLLEVGTGFHPELTGRENIFLNGVILGLTRAEVKKRFDEIVAFAETEQFLDTPVKHYSSGMYVRLAFAVAAHLDPDILIVDEVLAVGDAQFQKKCLGKMRSVSQETGRTVLLVSHNLAQLSSISDRCLLLDQGRLTFDGTTAEATQTYFSNAVTATAEFIATRRDDAAHIHRIRIETSEAGNVHVHGKALSIEIEVHHAGHVRDAWVSFQLINASGQAAAHLWLNSGEQPFAHASGSTLFRCTIPSTRLNVGFYRIRAFFSGPPGSNLADVAEPELVFEVVRLDQTIAFGWRPDACAYFEDAAWDVRCDHAASPGPIEIPHHATA